MKILGQRVLAEKLIDDKKTASGLIVPNENKFEALVLAVSDKCDAIKVGDKISYHQGAGQPMKHEGKDCLFLHEKNDCIAVL